VFLKYNYKFNQEKQENIFLPLFIYLNIAININEFLFFCYMKDLVLLADPKTSAWEFAKKIQSYIENTKEKKIPLLELEKKVFGDEEFKPHIKENVRKKDLFYIQSTSNKSPSDWLTEIILTANMCLKADANSLSLVLPYMRYMRQDRKDESRVPISTRAIADAISPGIERLITMDMHAPQIENAYAKNCPLDNLQSFPQVSKYLKENHSSYLKNLAIVSPDVGGGGRARALHRSLIKLEKNPEYPEGRYSLAVMDKVRNKAGEIISMTLIGNVKRKNVLIVDDILDSGGSAIKAAEELKRKGANKLLCYATHGLFTKGTEDILKSYDVVMTSNTHYSPKNGEGKVEIIDMTPTFAEAIYRAQEGLSISRLFD
jgi:ribose-phosphate pyrophosphokinase